MGGSYMYLNSETIKGWMWLNTNNKEVVMDM